MTRAWYVIIGLFVIAVLSWWLNIYLKGISFSGRIVIKEFIYITGVISFLYMGLIMVLSIRPKFLENFFGGMDKIYYLHKRAGILAIVFAGMHYVIELSKKWLLLLVNSKNNINNNPLDLNNIELFFREFRSVAKTLGEYTIYFLLIMLVLTLWQKFPYKIWRYLHKTMAPAFLILSFHTVILSPISYWLEPIGILLLTAITVGSVCAIISMFGLIGKKHTFKGEVIKLIHYDNLIEITCKLSGDWYHKAGQYAFLRHDWLEGAHPFTISSADIGNNTIRFSIKGLGDYTKKLQVLIAVGDKVEIEGPYGRFNYKRAKFKNQIWIAGGIGITPFISWLEEMIKDNDTQTLVDLYYCVHSKNKAPYIHYLNELCSFLPNVVLHPYYSRTNGYLTLNQLSIQDIESKKTSEIWFCASNKFAKQIKKDLRKKRNFNSIKFHQEIFKMR